MEIRKYRKEKDEDKLMEIIRLEGEEWKDYSASEVANKYKKALENSITYVAYEKEQLCGYSRSINDNDYYIYVCDLLVTPKYRGKSIGRSLMECIYNDYADVFSVLVMSDVDEYYRKQEYKREGSIFKVINRN